MFEAEEAAAAKSEAELFDISAEASGVGNKVGAIADDGGSTPALSETYRITIIIYDIHRLYIVYGIGI